MYEGVFYNQAEYPLMMTGAQNNNSFVCA